MGNGKWTEERVQIFYNQLRDGGGGGYISSCVQFCFLSPFILYPRKGLFDIFYSSLVADCVFGANDTIYLLPTMLVILKMKHS